MIVVFCGRHFRCSVMFVCLATLLLCFTGVSCYTLTSLHKRCTIERSRALEADTEREGRTMASCMSAAGRSRRSLRDDNDVLRRYPRQASVNVGDDLRSSGKFGSALYFGGQEALRAKDLAGAYGRISHKAITNFSVEIWIRAEGGQADPVTIIGFSDKCRSGTNGWSIELRASGVGDRRDARIYFALHTDHSREQSVISSVLRYRPNHWTHVAATYDGRRMTLFVGGAKVAVGNDQKGALFIASALRCKELYLARRSAADGTLYRGAVDELRLWNTVRRHRDIVRHMYKVGPVIDETITDDSPFLWDSFGDQRAWQTAARKAPRHVDADIDSEAGAMYLVAPPCGETVCDDPDVVRSYTRRWQLRRPKTVKYRVVNVMHSDGSGPTVTEEQIRYQHAALRLAFKPYNISWQLDVAEVHNTSLRVRTILFGCDPAKVGNGRCNPECSHERTGQDGGDCDLVRLSCNESDIGNGRCDAECNRAYHDWDGGDCCDTRLGHPAVTCFDPASPSRAYMSADEYKEVLAFSGKQHLNIFFGQWTIPGLIGVATFPWENEAHGVYGGILVKPDSFGRPDKTDSLVHEIGHALGLWHVHHGVSEMDCDDPCLETTPSLQLGDLCADTNPTTENSLCSDPSRSAPWPCGIAQHSDTPYNNYMSYSDDACTDHFSDQQMARMHCYLDLVYQRLQKEKRPSPVPFAPKVVATDETSVELRWLPPLGTGVAVFNEVCGACGADNSLLQYAASATVVNASRRHGPWAPLQTIGPPDAEACVASTKAWMPDEACDKECYIELGFSYPVVPKRVSVWVVWNAINAIKDVQLLFKDGGSLSLGRVPVYCDMPFTTELKLVSVVDKVRIYVNSPYVSIDAVSLQSAPDSFRCRSCRPLSYTVQRQPPFSGDTVVTTEPRYVDRSVVQGKTYSYKVQPRLGSKMNYFSEQLVYIHGGRYCGDGRVDSEAGEACDDGNAADGDGCSITCQTENSFHCAGEPSVCYRHDGDGVCEDFERRSSVQDCGFYTPDGYNDQWAAEAVANPAFQLDECPADVIAGPPSLAQGCNEDFDGTEAWHPCGNWNDEDNYWLLVTFQRPVIATTVIIYLASDGINGVDPEPKLMSVSLVDTQNANHSLTPTAVVVSCRKSPLHLNVMHDLSQPLFKTEAIRIEFRSYHIAISAVALRTSDSFGALEANTCGPDSLYNSHTNRCVPYQCHRPVCRLFMIKFGSAHCIGDKEGDTCSVVCDNGYLLATSADHVRCVNGSWEGDVRCAPVDCGEAYIPHARIDCPGGTTYRKRCKMECRSPARKQGSGHMLECQADGAWSFPGAFCQVVCPRTPRVKNAALVGRQCRLGRLDVTTRCRFRCNLGFHVIGEPVKRRLFRQTCTDDGTWSGPRCERVECEVPPVVYEGLYSCTDGYYSGSRCTLKCPQPNGATSTITCLRTGEWSSNFTSCNFPPGPCPAPVDSDDVHYQCSGTDIGSKCTIVCALPSQEPALLSSIISDKARLMRDEKGYVAVYRIMCTGRLSWFPDTAGIACVQQCSSDFIGDGFCDARNNQPFCNWDGGDCCPSTVNGGRLQPFPVTCTDDCSCRDPDAIENKNLNRVRAHFRHHHNIHTRKQRDI